MGGVMLCAADDGFQRHFSMNPDADAFCRHNFFWLVSPLLLWWKPGADAFPQMSLPCGRCVNHYSVAGFMPCAQVHHIWCQQGAATFLQSGREVMKEMHAVTRI